MDRHFDVRYFLVSGFLLKLLKVGVITHCISNVSKLVISHLYRFVTSSIEKICPKIAVGNTSFQGFDKPPLALYLSSR